MADDLVLISWNVEKKGLSGLESADTTELIARSIAETVEAVGSSGVETPFVAYLLEIKGEDADIQKMCGRLKAAYKKATKGQDIEVVADNLEGGEYTTEAIITMSRGVTVKNRALDLQPKIANAVQADEAQAGIAFQKKSEARASRKRKATPDWLEPKPEHFRANLKEPGWFRNGVFSDIRLGETKLQASIVHSPGPSHVKDFPQSVDAARDTAAENGSDLLLGDFNRDGEFAGEDFTDTLSPLGKGTTFSKKAMKSGKLELGPRKRDRVFELKHSYSRWRFTTHEPIVKGRGLGEARLTDHAMICVGATPKSKREMRQYFREALSDDVGLDSDDEMLETIARTGDIEGTSWFDNDDDPDMSDDDEYFDSNRRTKRRKKVTNADDLGVFVNNTNAHNATPDDYDALEEEETGLLSQPASDAGGQSPLLSDPIANPTSVSPSPFDTPPTTTAQSDTVDTTDGEAAGDTAMDATDAATEELGKLAVLLL